jgi:hypothetical protein
VQGVIVKSASIEKKSGVEPPHSKGKPRLPPCFRYKVRRTNWKPGSQETIHEILVHHLRGGAVIY